MKRATWYRVGALPCIVGTLAILLLLTSLSTGCSKSAAASNWAIISENGSIQAFDSMRVSVKTSNGQVSEVDMLVFLNHVSLGSGCEIYLYFSPSDPAYTAGTTIDLTTGKAALLYIKDNTQFWDATLFSPNASLTITTNNPATRRIEGTINNCVVKNIDLGTRTNADSSKTLMISGSFGVSY